MQERAESKPQILYFKVTTQKDYFEFLNTQVNDKNYQLLIEGLLIRNDHLAGVYSHIEIDERKQLYPTGCALVRDTRLSVLTQQAATSSDSTESLQTERVLPLSPDDPEIESNNMLMRTLSTMRAIEHVLKQKENTDQQAYLQHITRNLIHHVEEFQQALTTKVPYPLTIEELEVNFNRLLKECLITVGILKNDVSDKECEKLLLHYRGLSATLDSAKSMVTIQEYAATEGFQNGSFTHVETAHPITQKTEQQKRELNIIDGYRSGENFYTAQSIAMRIASVYFRDRLLADDSILPPAAKESIGPCIRNGYVVHQELYGTQQLPNKPIAETWSVRCGVLSYAGEGESDERRIGFARENIAQIQEHINRLRYQSEKQRLDIHLHLISLLTDSPLKNQHKALKAIEKAKNRENAQNKRIFWSYFPLNMEGLTRITNISSFVREQAKVQKKELPRRSLDAQSERLEKASTVGLIAAESSDSTNVTFCMSGQDRTGTMQEACTERWLECHIEKVYPSFSFQTIQEFRAHAGHNAVLASLATPGSPRMRLESCVGDFFPSDTLAYFYGSSAGWRAPLQLKSLKKSLKEVYQDTLKRINEAQDLLTCITAIQQWMLVVTIPKPPQTLFSFVIVGLFSRPSLSAMHSNEFLEKLNEAVQEKNEQQLLRNIRKIQSEIQPYFNQGQSDMLFQLNHLLQCIFDKPFIKQNQEESQSEKKDTAAST